MRRGEDLVRPAKGKSRSRDERRNTAEHFVTAGRIVVEVRVSPGLGREGLRKRRGTPMAEIT